MGNESTVHVTIKVDSEKGIVSVKQFGAEAEKSFSAVESKAASAGKNIDSSSGSCEALGAAAARLGPIIAAAFSVDQIARFAGECVAAASRLEETNNKFSVVFNGQIALANRWAAELAGSYQLSEEQGKAYLSTISNMLWAMGMTTDAAGKLSFEVVKLAADMSSFHNIDTAQVMGDIQSALSGQYETMKKYGVVLMETTVSQKALAMGLARTKDELTAAHKAQAALKIITEGSGAAIGDIARSYDSYANTARRFTTETEGLAAAIGDKLLPVLTKLKGGIADAAGNLTRALRNSTEDQIKTIELQVEGLENGIKGVTKNKAFYGEIYGNWVIKKNKEQISALKETLAGLKAQQALYEQDVAALTNAARVNGGATPPPPDIPTHSGGTNLSKTTNPKTTPISNETWMMASGGRWSVQGLRDSESAQAAMALDEGSAALIRRKNTEMLRAASETNTEMVQLSQRTAEAMEQNFSDFYFDVMTGKFKSLEDYGTAMFQSLARAASDVMGQMTKTYLFGSSAGAGLLGQWVTSARGNVFELGRVAAFETGGILTKPVIFPMASGYGLAGEAGPEAIMPLKRMGNGNLGVETSGTQANVTVNVINNTSAEVQVQESRTADGGVQLDVLVDEVMASKVTRGKFATALQRAYNLKPNTIRR